jgi:hypothetical protein
MRLRPTLEGLMSAGVNLPNEYRRVADYVDKSLDVSRFASGEALDRVFRDVRGPSPVLRRETHSVEAQRSGSHGNRELRSR